MAFQLNTLTQYVNDNSQTLYTKAVLDFRSVGIKGIGSMRMEPDVKSTKRIHTLDQDVVIQPAASGQFVSSGNTNLAQVDLSVTKIMINNELYVEQLSDYFLQLSLKAGYNDTLPKAVEEIYVKQ